MPASRCSLLVSLALLIRVFGASSAFAQSDVCETATTIEVPSESLGSTAGAASDGPGCTGADSDAPGVWYTFLGTGAEVSASLCWPENQAFDTQLSVYAGPSCDALDCVAGNDDACRLQSAVEFATTIGVRYWVLVHGFGGASGEFRLRLSANEPIENDDCATALPVVVPSETFGTTRGADADGEGCTGVETQEAPGVWYSLRGTGFPVTASLCWPENASFDTQLSVYTGASCDALACLAGNDDDAACGRQSTVQFETSADESYYLLVHGYNAASGDFRLTLSGEVSTETRFRRGETDQDGRLSITDAVAILGYLFRGLPGSVPDCLDAADADDNGQVALTDAIVVLAYLFQRGSPPPAPGPTECGVDPTPDDLGCDRVPTCTPVTPGFTRVDALRIDTQGRIAETAGGEPVLLELDFAARNPGDRPTARRQIVIGIEDLAILCLYDGIPGSDETLEITRTLAVDAPVAEGVYNIYAFTSELADCDAAIDAYQPGLSAPIGTLSVVAPPPRIEVEAVRISGDTVSVNRSGDIEVIPEREIRVEVDYAALSSKSCRDCPQQLVVGLEEEVLGCAVSGVFPVHGEGEPVRGTATFTTTVSELPGIYDLYARSVRPAASRASDCDTALELYGRPRGILEPIASFIVRQGAFVTSLSVNGAGNEATVEAGTPVEFETIYTAANNPECPECVSWNALYYEPVFEGALALDDAHIGCPFVGIPGVVPETGRSVFSKSAPLAAGSYRILQTQFSESQLVGARACQNAGQMINAVRPEVAYEVGRLNVLPGVFVTEITLQSGAASSRVLDVAIDSAEVRVVSRYFATNDPGAPEVVRRAFVLLSRAGELLAAQQIYENIASVGTYDEGDEVFSIRRGDLEGLGFGALDFHALSLPEGVPEPSPAELAAIVATAPLATLHIGGVTVERLALEGADASSTVEVEPGAFVNVEVDYRTRVQSGCTDCQRFIVVGIDGAPATCINPGVQTGEIFDTWRGSIEAPGVPGDYGVYTQTVRAVSCGAAFDAYRRPRDRVATIRVRAPSVPAGLEPTAASVLPPAMTLGWDDLVSGGFVTTLQQALNSPGDEITIGIEFRAEASLFSLVSVGTTVNFNVGLARNDENFYELSLAAGKAHTAGVGLTSMATAGVSAGATGTIVFTVRTIEDIPTALRQFAIALVLKPAAGLINDVIDGLNDAIATIDQGIRDLGRAIEDLANAIDVKNRCVLDNPLFLFSPADCQACVLVTLNARLALLRVQRAAEDRRRGAHMDAIGQLDTSTAFFNDSNDALIGTSLGIEFEASGSLEAQLSPFPGVTVEGATAGISLTAMLGGGASIELGPQGDLEAAVLQVHGTVSIEPVLGTTRIAASIGIIVETRFLFVNGSYQGVGDATVTLFVDAEVETGVGVAFTGIGRRYEVEIDLLQFQSNSSGFARFLSSGDPELLARALSGIEATFSVQDRRTLGVRFGIDLSIEVITVGFTGEVKWTDAGPKRSVSYTLGEGLAVLFDPDSVHALQDQLALQLR